jgi:hypothetical protein
LTGRRVKAEDKGKEGKGNEVADAWALPVSDRSEDEACGWSWWAGLVAGPAG